MPRLLANGRSGQLAALLVVAVVQLAAAIFAARGMHLAIDGRLKANWALPAIAGVALCALLLEGVQRRLCEGLGQAYVNEVRDTLFEHILSVESDTLQRRRHGAMLQAFVGDLTALRLWVSEGIMRGAIALLGIAGLLTWMATASPVVAAALLVPVLAAIAAGILLLRPLDRAVRDVRRARGRVAGFASERLAAIATVQASGRLPSERTRLRNRVGKLTSAVLSRAWLTGFLHGLPALAVTLMMLVVAELAGGSSSGQIAGQFVLIGLLGLVLRDLARAGQLMIPGRVSRERIEALLSLPRMQFGPDRPIERPVDAHLALDRVELLPGMRPASATAQNGQIVLVDGDAKLRRALFRTLTGRAKPHRGKLLYGNHCLSEMSARRRRQIIGCYSPELPLLRASTRYNVRYRAPQATREEVHSLALRLDFDPDARDQSTVRILLARALLGTPPILVLELSGAELDRDDYRLLIKEVGDHPGVVLMTTDHAELRNLATQRWDIDPRGLTETAQPPKGPLSLVPPHQREVNT